MSDRTRYAAVVFAALISLNVLAVDRGVAAAEQSLDISQGHDR